jgi:hypothetical protein
MPASDLLRAGIPGRFGGYGGFGTGVPVGGAWRTDSRQGRSGRGDGGTAGGPPGPVQPAGFQDRIRNLDPSAPLETAGRDCARNQTFEVAGRGGTGCGCRHGPGNMKLDGGTALAGRPGPGSMKLQGGTVRD